MRIKKLFLKPLRLCSYNSHLAADVVDIHRSATPLCHGQFSIEVKPPHYPFAVGLHHTLAIGLIFVTYGVDSQPAESFLLHLVSYCAECRHQTPLAVE